MSGPAGLWHAEWHALPQLFGLASGALREGRRLAEGLEIDAARMRANLDATKGLLFADSAASALTGAIGRGEAHKLVEEAAEVVRRTGSDLRSVLGELAGEHAAALDKAFDLAPAVAAASRWVEPAVEAAAQASAGLDLSNPNGDIMTKPPADSAKSRGATFEEGLANRKRVLGAEHVERSLAKAGAFAMPWQDFITRTPGARSGATRRSRGRRARW